MPSERRYLRFLRPDVRADVDDELRFHFDSRVEELVAAGATPADARAQAVREFGDVDAVRDSLVSIDHRRIARRSRADTLRDIAADILYAVRSLRRTPGVALAVLATLALGVGVNAAMFTLLHTMFLRPPSGVADAASIRRLWSQRLYSDGLHVAQAFSHSAWRGVLATLGDRGDAVLYRAPTKIRIGAGESADEARLSFAPRRYFDFLGVHAERGRLYSPEEDDLDSPSPVAVVSHAYWQRALDADPDVVGRPLIISGRRHTIIGVADEAFAGTELDAADLWIPVGWVAAGRSSRATGRWYDSPNVNGFVILVRPNHGVDIRELEQRITVALRRPEISFGRADTNTVARFGSIIAANGPGDKSQEQRIAVRLAGVAGIVLLIACANVVNLLLARAVRRRRGIAVRLALGISRGRLVRLLLAESGVLAAAAACVAVLVAYVGGALLRRLLLPDVHWSHSPLDLSVLLFALVVALLAGGLAGLIPALQASSPELTAALKSGAGDGGAPHRSRLRAALVIAQAGLSVVLLVGAALFVRSLANVRKLDIGFDANRLMSVSVGFDDRTRNGDPSVPLRLAEVARRANASPGVEHAALVSMEPLGGFSTIPYFSRSDSLGSRQGWFPTVFAVSRDFIGTAGLRVLKGSDFPSTATGDRTVIVNDEMARGLWPNENAVGQCLWLESRTEPCHRVIGVVENGRVNQITEQPHPQFYLPFDQVPAQADYLRPWYVLVRAVPERVPDVAQRMRALVREELPGGIPTVKTMADRLEPQYRPWRLGAALFTAFGVLALVVAVVGIYSTVSYGVSQRTREFGVRIALGAGISDVLKLVVAEGLRTVLIGIALGVAAALAAGRLVASLLYGVRPSDPSALAFVAIALVAVATVAALIPAWRASRVNPVAALRTD